MENLQKRLKVAVIINNTTLRNLSKEWGISENALRYIATGQRKSKRIIEKINQYIGGEK